MEKTIGFIGGGRVTGIFLEGWKRAGKVPARVTVSDPNADTLAKLKERYPSITCTADSSVAAAQEIVFLALHPPAMPDAAGSIRSSIRKDAIVVSLAPKFAFAKLSGLLGFDRLARVIPNAPSVVNFGFNPVAFAAALTQADKQEVTNLLSPLGECPIVAEEKLEGYAIMTAMAPTFFWFQMQALREVAAGFGFAENEITPAMKRMICGSARTLLESGLTPAEVIDLVPVKPLAEMEASVNELYRTRLPALYQKIKP